MSFAFRSAAKVLIFLSTKHRLLGVRDWTASLISTTLLVLIGAAGAAQALGFLQFSTTSDRFWQWCLLGVAIAALIVVAFPAVSFVLKLRRNGITDADYSVESGVDYKAALSGVGGGFDFLGMSGSKLTGEEMEFREAVTATVRADKKIRMLLVDPKSTNAFGKLERHDETVGYSENIAGSIQFINALAKKDPEHLELRFYDPETGAGFKPFRLFFSDGDCLISPFVKATGVNNQGRGLPQIRISNKGWPGSGSPTLYRGFERYFDECWRMGVAEKRETI